MFTRHTDMHYEVCTLLSMYTCTIKVLCSSNSDVTLTIGGKPWYFPFTKHDRDKHFMYV